MQNILLWVLFIGLTGLISGKLEAKARHKNRTLATQDLPIVSMTFHCEEGSAGLHQVRDACYQKLMTSLAGVQNDCEAIAGAHFSITGKPFPKRSVVEDQYTLVRGEGRCGDELNSAKRKDSYFANCYAKWKCSRN